MVISRARRHRKAVAGALKELAGAAAEAEQQLYESETLSEFLLPARHT